MTSEETGLEVAVIGISGRFPGSKTVDVFWENLINGLEFASVFSKENGAAPQKLEISNGSKKEIKAAALLEDIELFDASFFGFNPREAEIMDPQHRLFLECAWEAIENAGYDSEREERPIGVYAGVGRSTYLLYNLLPNNLNETLGYFPILIASDKDYVPTRVSYKLNLTGPSISVGTACSSSLVAVHLAYQSLLSGECSMALAAGVSVKAPQNEATLCPEGISPDGRCFTFDARANGTIGGNGIGVVVLKRLEDAIADQDYIYAVIKGSAINNDGAVKVSYTAPSEEAQARVIRAAQIMAEVESETITYIETHGTGTALGDPIEIAGLKQAFPTDKKAYCAIGSVKTNIGHLDAAAGIASFIKTALALDRKLLPPSLNFEKPNPQIDFENSPFYVNTKLVEWKANGTPRRAGVSSFGFGGTNAHVILEEAPQVQPSATSRPWQLLMLSAKTISALDTATANLVEHLKQHPELNLADVAYTLQVGRREFGHRRIVVCKDLEDAAIALQDPKRVLTSIQETSERPVAFMFTGLGTHYVNMAWELYQVEPTFQRTVDRCCELLKPLIGLDLTDILYPRHNQTSIGSQQPNSTKSAPQSGLDLRKMLGRDQETAEEATQKLNQTRLTQPAIFVIEYALAQLWISWGIRPTAMIGYSIGEYVAACLAEVLSLEDALTLVAKRAQMIQELPNGAMLAVPLSEEEVRPLLSEKLSLSAINGSKLCVIAGDMEAVDELVSQLTEKGLACRRLQASHAFHSHTMEPIAKSFSELVKTVSLKPPQIPYLSNVTGTWITEGQVTDPSYWTEHLCQPVRFAEGVNELWKQQTPILLEVGPGQTLSSLALQCVESEQVADQVILPSLRDAYNQHSDLAFLLNTLGQLWLSGVRIDWSGFYTKECRHRIPLPTYPFERQRYWIEPPQLSPSERQFQPIPTASDLWKSLVEAGHLQAIALTPGFDAQTYQEQKLCMDRLCIAYINQTLRRLGIFSESSEKYSFEGLFEKGQVISNYRQLFARFLDILVEQGHLQQDEGIFSNLLPLSTGSIHSLIEDFKVKWANVSQITHLLQRCGENLHAVLIGEKEPLEFHVDKFVKEGEVSLQNMPFLTYYNAIMRAILEQALKSLPPSVNLRILEIGAGEGITTAELLPILASRQTTYTFTDVGGWFLNKAEQKFNDYPFIEYRFLDIERSPSEQGYSANSFDLVIASNVIHVTRNIGESLEHVRSLLAPQGLLLMWEITQPQLLFDVADGLLMKPVEGEGRNQGNPFLSKAQWQEALSSHGFIEVEAFSEIDAFGQHVFVAQASSTPEPLVPAAFTATFEQKDADQMAQASSGKKPDIADWFYVPSWKRSTLPPFDSIDSTLQVSQPGCWLVFADECGLGDQMVKRLKLEGQGVITVRIEEQFSSERKSPADALVDHVYAINPQQRDDYDALFKELRTLGINLRTIVHLWSVTPPVQTELGFEEVDEIKNLGFYSLLFLAQALGEQNLTEPLEIGILSNNMQELTGLEELSPEKALILGPCKVIPTEYPNIKCRSVDVVVTEPDSWQCEKLVDQLLAEFTTQTSDQIIAYRGLHRWVQTFESIRLDEVIDQKPCLREEGVYLITGGLGGVALTLAEYMAQTVKAKLILTGRSAFPDRDEWSQWLSTHDQDNDISVKIQKVQNLEALGAEVLVVSADVTNFEQMSAVVTQANHRFGQIHGVIHAAFIPGGGMIQLRTPEAVAADIAPKVRGTRVLDLLFNNSKLDFFVMCSSIYGYESQTGQVDYVAECAFVDAFAHYSVSRNGNFTRTINWEGWNGIGRSAFFATKYKEITGEDHRVGMTPEEGIEVFRRILSNSTIPQIVVCTQDLLALKEAENKLSLKFLQKKNISKTRRQRPGLKNAYVAPASDLEHKIVESFENFLGFERVGVHDNFFALGGDSLTGSVLINQLRDSFQIELPLRTLFEASTAAELAVVVEKILIEELAELTEEEANLTLETS